MFSQGKHNGQSVNLGGTKQRFNYLPLDSAPIPLSASFVSEPLPTLIDVTFDKDINGSSITNANFSFRRTNNIFNIVTVTLQSSNVLRFSGSFGFADPGDDEAIYVAGTLEGSNGLAVESFTIPIT